VRFAVISDRWSDRGGADQHLHQIVRRLVGRGDEVVCCAGRGEPPDGVAASRIRGLDSPVHRAVDEAALESVVQDADRVVVQNVMNPTALDAIEGSVGPQRLRSIVQDHRSFCPGPGRTIPGRGACTESFVRADCRQCLPDDGYRRRMEALTEARAEALRRWPTMVLSEYMAAEVVRAGWTEVTVVPPWVTVAPPRRSVGSHFVMGGRLVRHKGVAAAVAAWREAGAPLPMVIAGDGPEIDACAGATVLGWLSRQDWLRHLEDVRALLFPPLWQEPFGILGLEALSRGVPVIVSDVGGTRDWSGAGSIHVPPGDVDAMADAIRWVSEHPAKAAELGERGRRWVEQQFSVEVIAPRLEAFLG
jgi:glycosyltransferase involved in cell wall biosynthesis